VRRNFRKSRILLCGRKEGRGGTGIIEIRETRTFVAELRLLLQETLIEILDLGIHTDLLESLESLLKHGSVKISLVPLQRERRVAWRRTGRPRRKEKHVSFSRECPRTLRASIWISIREAERGRGRGRWGERGGGARGTDLDGLSARGYCYRTAITTGKVSSRSIGAPRLTPPRPVRGHVTGACRHLRANGDPWRNFRLSRHDDTSICRVPPPALRKCLVVTQVFNHSRGMESCWRREPRLEWILVIERLCIRLGAYALACENAKKKYFNDRINDYWLVSAACRKPESN